MDGPADGTRLAWAPGLVLPWGLGEPQTESVRLAASKYADVRESFLAGGFAQERSLDEHIASHGSLPRSDKALEADWLTTTEAFYYVTPMIGSVYRWDWELTGSIKNVRRGPAFTTLELGLCGGAAPLRLRVSRPAAENLTAIVKWVRSRRSGPAAGWYSDPSGQPWLRYWDGATWTEHYAIETPTRSGTSNE